MMTLLLNDMLFYYLYVIVPNTSILKSNMFLDIKIDLNKSANNFSFSLMSETTARGLLGY